MEEQSDTPETDAAEREDAGPITHAIRGWNYARKHERERDEARAEVAEIESVLRASGSLNQKLLDEVDRLRALTICGCGDHFNAAFRGLCPNCVAAGKVAP